jgi:hypothetical protein
MMLPGRTKRPDRMTTPPSPHPEPGNVPPSGQTSGLRRRFLEDETVRFCILLALFTFAAVTYIRQFYMSDPDFGWHLRTGEWILSHHAVPRADLFSNYGAGKPWCDYSWLFDIFFAFIYRLGGLLGLGFLELAFRVAIPVIIYHLVRNLELSFWLSTITSALAVYSMYSIYAPRPGMFTILFFVVELRLLLGASLKGEFSKLLWLPPLFLVWACIHIQFVYGLIVLAMFVGEPLLNLVVRHRMQAFALPPKSAWLLLASIAATLITPYGWHIYSTVVLYARQKNIYGAISEMLALSFREPFHFALLFLVLGTAMTLGRSRSPRPLYLLLFAFSAVIGFRSIKDVWLVVIVSVALIAVSVRDAAETASHRSLAPKQQLALAICVVAVLAVALRRYDASNSWIEMGLAGRYPEAAVRFVERNHLRGPLYNDFTSGGFLIWRLPAIPVSMDGRTNVHGDDRVKAYDDSLRGRPGWENDPDLARANLIIWPTKSPLSGLLRCDSRFKQVFADPQAVVFVRR